MTIMNGDWTAFELLPVGGVDDNDVFFEIAMRRFTAFAENQPRRIKLGEEFDPAEWAAHWAIIAARAYAETKEILQERQKALDPSTR